MVDGGWVTGAELVVGAGAELVVGAAAEFVVGAGETPPDVDVEADAVVAVLWWTRLCFFFCGSAFFLVVVVVGVVAAVVFVELEWEAALPQPATARTAATISRDLFIDAVAVLARSTRLRVQEAPALTRAGAERSGPARITGRDPVQRLPSVEMRQSATFAGRSEDSARRGEASRDRYSDRG